MFASYVLRVRELISATSIGETLTNDLESQGRMTLHLPNESKKLHMLKQRICFASNALWVRLFIPTTAECVALTDDLEIQGHMSLHVTLPLCGLVIHKVDLPRTRLRAGPCLRSHFQRVREDRVLI